MRCDVVLTKVVVVEVLDVLIYNIDGDSDAHAAFAIGSCLLDQHNPSRCSKSSNWGPNIVLSKK